MNKWVMGVCIAAFHSWIAVGQVMDEPSDSIAVSVPAADSLDVDSLEQQIMRNKVEQFIGSTKATIDEERPYDISAQPMTPGMRESLAVALGDFEKGESMFAPGKSSMSGKILLGYGSYSTPMLEAWLGTASQNADLLFRFAYKATDGRFANQNYHRGHAGLSAGVFLPERAGIFSNGRLHGETKFESMKYRLHGSSTPTRTRSVDRLTGSAGVNVDYEGGGYLNVKIRVENATVSDSVRTKENYAGIDIAGAGMIDQTRVEANATVSRDFYSSRTPSIDPYFANFGLGIEYRPTKDVRMNAGATVYLVRGNEQPSRTLFYPKLGLTWFVSRALKLQGEYKPYVHQASLSNLLFMNPFLDYEIAIQNPEYFQSWSIGAAFEVSSVLKGRVNLQHQKAHKYPIPIRQSTNLWSLDYRGTTRILLFESELYADVSENDNLGVTLNVSDSKVRGNPGLSSELETELPYLPRFTLSSTYQHRFSFGLRVGSTVKFVGQRKSDVSGSREMPSFALWNAHAELAFEHFSAKLSVDNVLNQKHEWWEKYPGEARLVMLSIGYMW